MSVSTTDPSTASPSSDLCLTVPATLEPPPHRPSTGGHHQRTVGLDKLSERVSKMVKPQALELISSTAGDRDEKANAYVDAVATTTAELLRPR